MDHFSPADPAARPTAYDRVLGYLLGRINYERISSIPYRSAAFRLDRMRELARRLGDPQSQLRIIHVAGTKGKGSTAAILASVLRCAGYRVGLYTSPHLQRLEERFVVDGQPCSPDELITLTDTVSPAVSALDAACAQGRGPTFFEITTAMALRWFAERAVDVAVLEVGLGGRLDSTNICQPEVSVITSISFDHMKQLGNTLPEIAREKAGIIKPRVPAISGVTDPGAAAAIEAVANQQDAPLMVLGRDFGYQSRAQNPAIHATGPRGHAIQYWEQDRDGEQPIRIADLQLGMLGAHQALNAAVATATLRQLERQGWRLPQTALAEGLLRARCPARMEHVAARPDVVLDVAHNVASIHAFLETMDECFSPRRRILLFSASLDKDVEGMLRLVVPRFDAVILTRYCNNPRAVSPEVLFAMVQQIAERQPIERPPLVDTAPDPQTGLMLARRLAQPDDLICITGSFFLAAEVQPLLASQTLPGPAAAAAFL